MSSYNKPGDVQSCATRVFALRCSPALPSTRIPVHTTFVSIPCNRCCASCGEKHKKQLQISGARSSGGCVEINWIFVFRRDAKTVCANRFSPKYSRAPSVHREVSCARRDVFLAPVTKYLNIYCLVRIIYIIKQFFYNKINRRQSVVVFRRTSISDLTLKSHLPYEYTASVYSKQH